VSADPYEIEFDYSAHGKPLITNPAAVAADLRFNLAHSGGLALYAITCGCEIGIDLELIPAEFAWREIAERFFSANEVVKLSSLPASIQRRAFFNCWTRKEAFIKAKGVGFSQALDQFEVTLGPDEPVALVQTKWDQQEASRWVLKSIDLGKDFAAAMAIEGHDRKISFWEFDERMIPVSQSQSSAPLPVG
jgi:4'-phosphopantetheinyl transferase